MTWTYSQTTGELRAPDGTLAGSGYSGNGPDLNNPAAQDQIGHGPIPRGTYHIGPPHNPVDHLGRYAFPLMPEPSNEMFGRSGLFLHGDNAAMNHTASDGCIIMPLTTRIVVFRSSDKVLEVTT